jgi:hypothetical protein
MNDWAAMSFVCFNRISIVGPRSKVLKLRNDAHRRLSAPLKELLGESYVAFSLERLFRKNRLPVPSPDGIPFDTFRVGKDILAGHYFISRLPLVEWRGYARIEYRVEVKNYEIYQLLMPLSRSYPELCFVVSEISLDSGGINAIYVTRGRCSRWTLPEDRCDAHWNRAAKENGFAKLVDAYEDDSVRSVAEEGMLTEALAHWDQRVLRTLQRRNRP